MRAASIGFATLTLVLSLTSVPWGAPGEEEQCPPGGCCDDGASIRRLHGPRSRLIQLMKSARSSGDSPFWKSGGFHSEDVYYVGRITNAKQVSFQIVWMTTSWGQACRGTNRLLVFDSDDHFLGSYYGVSDRPNRVDGSTLYFPFDPAHGNVVSFSGEHPPPRIWLDGMVIDFGAASRD